MLTGVQRYQTMQIDRYNRHSGSEIIISVVCFVMIAVFIICVVSTVVNETHRIDEGQIVDRYIVRDTVNKIPRSSDVFVIEGEKNGKTVRYSCYVSAREYDTYRIGDWYKR